MKIKIHRVSLGLLALMTLGGCASFNDCYYEKTQRVRASKEYVHCGKPECSEYPHDYKKGWIDGFYEVATGGSDCPPAVAPARYYEPKEILKYCDKRRHAYYGGWQDGAARASCFPDTHYLRIYETEACPFPRCEKPCGNGQCRSCGDAFAGMSATTEMIEATPTLGIRQEYVANEILLSAPSKKLESVPNTDIELTIPEVNQVNAAPIQSTNKDISVPQATPAPKPVIDLPTLPLIPPSSIAAIPDLPTPHHPHGTQPSNESAAQATETPLVAIPGYRATTQWSRPAARSMKAQTVGFIRMVNPTQDAQKMQASEDGGSIVIVDAPCQHFRMSDTDTDAQPVIKLVE